MWTSSVDKLGNWGAEILHPCDFLSVISHLPKLPGHPQIAPPLGTTCLKHTFVGTCQVRATTHEAAMHSLYGNVTWKAVSR